MRTTRRHILLSLLMGWTLPVWAVAITDSVAVDGTTWAQVDLFAGLSWTNIDAVCPSGVCGTDTLNGFDMAGWHWASVDDLATVFNPFLVGNGFGGDDLLGPGADRFYWGFSNPGADFGGNFIDQGFRPTNELFGDRTLIGLTSDLVPGDPSLAYRGVVGDYPGQVQAALFGTDYTQPKNRGGLFSPGSWFFYTGNGEVPAPATLALFGLGLAGLGWSRRKP